jgi:RNA ligase (TIGR02306 family)
MKISTIQKIKNIQAHPNADALELATVLGWQVVIKLGEFKVGDLCVYIETDSVVPNLPHFEFLKKNNFRIKTIRLRGEVSNGLCLPLTILPCGEYVEGQDVTDLVGATHYEKPVPACLGGDTFGLRPSAITKTDELNLRSYENALKELLGKAYYITRKDDGSSGTYYMINGKFGVCSRNLELKETPSNAFWQMALKYNIQNVLNEKFPKKNIAIQGEVVGPGIQKNPLGLPSIEFHLFNIFDIDNKVYYDLISIKEFCNETKIPSVVLIEAQHDFQYTLQDLITISTEIKYSNNSPAEGIVIRPQFPFWSNVLNKYWSGKIINDLYSSKND